MCFICLMLNSALLLLLRSFGAALLILVSKSYLVAYLMGDMALYLLYKTAMNDWWHWMPFHGTSGGFVSFLMRTLVKFISDFTGVVQFRVMGEMGGAYWTFSMLLSIASTFVVMRVHFASIGEEEPAIKEETAWRLASALGGSWVVIFAAFMFMIKKKYRRTFYSLQTACQSAQALFLDEKNSDHTRAMIVERNKHQWQSIRPQVAEWFELNWLRWEEEKPVWFNPVFVSHVDDDLVPVEVIEELKARDGGVRRRSSFNEEHGELIRSLTSKRRENNPKVAPHPV